MQAAPEDRPDSAPRESKLPLQNLLIAAVIIVALAVGYFMLGGDPAPEPAPAVTGPAPALVVPRPVEPPPAPDIPKREPPPAPEPPQELVEAPPPEPPETSDSLGFLDFSRVEM